MTEEKYELKVLCPHCGELCKAPVFIKTDDENVTAMLELLTAFDIKGQKIEERKSDEI